MKLYCGLTLIILYWFIPRASGQKECSRSKVQTPGFPLNYPGNLRCQWLLTSKDNKSIVQFAADNLSMEKCNQPCGCDYLEIFDGATPSSKSLGKFCSGRVRMLSSSRNMLIVFHSDSSGSGSGFSATFTNVSRKDVCFRSSKTVETRYSSYGNIHCNWLLDAGPGNMMVMEKITLSFGYCNYCSCGQLEAYDGKSGSESRLGSWCSTPVPELISTGRYMYIKFSAKSYATVQKFQALLKIIQNQTVCSTTLVTVNSGIIKSYDYPSKYIKNKVECYWPIVAAKDQVVRLTVETLDLSGCENCGKLQIYDGKSTTSPSLGEWYSGTVDLVSSENAMVITFSTALFATADGFKARYHKINKKQLCKEASVKRGRISSYKYPKPYPGNMQCTWLIKSSSGSVIRLTTGSLDFPRCDGELCDYLDVYDGATRNHPKISRFKSGQEIDMVSSHDRLFIVFKSQVLKKDKGLNGFRAQYYSIKKTEVCPGSGSLYATRDVKSFSSRNYPNPYWGNVRCSWHIEANPDYVIRLTVQALYIEECEPNCNCDYLEVFNGSSSDSRSLGRWCGHDTPDLLSSGRYMFVVMRTNLFKSDQGFKAVYSSIHKREVCPGSGRLRHNTGVIHSPDYPLQYKGSHTCVWMIEGLPNQVVHLNTRSKRLELEKCGLSTTCTCDSLEVFDGLMYNASMGKWCETELNVLSSGRFLKLIFTSNEDTSGGGFELEYVILNKSKVCPVVEVSQTTGTINSFNYPKGFSGNIACSWNLKAPHAESVIHFVFQDFQLDTSCDSSTPCERCGSNVQAYDLAQSPMTIAYQPWCRYIAPKLTFFHTSNVDLKFKSNSRTHGKGFAAKYRYVRKNLGCRGIGLLKQPSGKLQGPDYPFGQIPEYFCAWQINVPDKSKIRITVTYKSVQQDLPCFKHFLEIFDGPHPSNQSLGRICLNTIGHDVISKGPDLYIMLWIESNLDEKNRPIFSATYGKAQAPKSSSGDPSKNTVLIVVLVLVAVLVIAVVFVYLVWKIKCCASWGYSPP